MYIRYKIKSINKIIDGDTIHLSLNLGFGITYDIKLRIEGIDAPEIRTKNLDEKKRGLLCKQYAVYILNKVDNKELYLLTKEHPGESFGRIVGDIYITKYRLFSSKMMEFIEALKKEYDPCEKESIQFDRIIKTLRDIDTTDDVGPHTETYTGPPAASCYKNTTSETVHASTQTHGDPMVCNLQLNTNDTNIHNNSDEHTSSRNTNMLVSAMYDIISGDCTTDTIPTFPLRSDTTCESDVVSRQSPCLPRQQGLVDLMSGLDKFEDHKLDLLDFE